MDQQEKVVYAYATKGGKKVETEKDGVKRERLVGAQRTGCVAVIEAAGTLFYGWSLCRKGDTFSAKVARTVALNRAHAYRDYYYGGRARAIVVYPGGSRKHTLPQTLGSTFSRAMEAAGRALLGRGKENGGPRD